MKNAWMNITHFLFSLFNLKFSGEIVTRGNLFSLTLFCYMLDFFRASETHEAFHCLAAKTS